MRHILYIYCFIKFKKNPACVISIIVPIRGDSLKLSERKALSEDYTAKSVSLSAPHSHVLFAGLPD